MSNGEQRPQSRPQASSGGGSQDEIDAKMPPPGRRSVTDAQPAWLDRFVWRVLWKFVAVSLTTALLLLLARELRHLLWLLVVSSFFALAMVPGVEQPGRGPLLQTLELRGKIHCSSSRDWWGQTSP